MRFTAETPTGSRSGSSRDSWTWDFCWSRWTPAATRSSAARPGNPGASWYPEDRPWREAVTPGTWRTAPDPDHPGADAPGNDPLVRPHTGSRWRPAATCLTTRPSWPGRAGDLSSGDPLDCAYDGLRFVPLSAAGVGHGSGLEEDRGPFATAAALLRFAEKYVGGISDHPV